jgi:hypothetical protein
VEEAKFPKQNLPAKVFNGNLCEPDGNTAISPRSLPSNETGSLGRQKSSPLPLGSFFATQDSLQVLGSGPEVQHVAIATRISGPKQEDTDGRVAHLHNGVDIGVPASPSDTNVFTVAPGEYIDTFKPGTLNEAIRIGDFTYVHTKSLRFSKDGRMIPAGTLIGTTNALKHVHLIWNAPDGSKGNALEVLVNYVDSASPGELDPKLFDHSTKERLSQLPNGDFVLTPAVDVEATGFDSQSLGSSFVGLFAIGYRVDGGSPGSSPGPTDEVECFQCPEIFRLPPPPPFVVVALLSSDFYLFVFISGLAASEHSSEAYNPSRASRARAVSSGMKRQGFKVRDLW